MVPQIPEAVVVHDDIDLELQRDRERKGLEG
jgi:peptidyl-tRNA hydrolase